MSRKPGPKTNINLLKDDIEKVAEVLKLRLLSRGGVWDIFVDAEGDVVMERTDQPSRALAPPDHWRVGTYTKAVKIEDLESDLVARYYELRPRRAA